MIKDHSLQEIDILKLIMFVLAFIFVLVFMITIFIIPSIKEYKKSKIENQNSHMNLLKIEEIYMADAGALNAFEQENNKSFKAVLSNFDERDFLNNTSRFFDGASLAKLGNSDDNKSYACYELNVTARLDSPQKFYDFLDFLNSYNNIILLDFPVKMQSRRGLIDTSFELKILKSKLKLNKNF